MNKLKLFLLIMCVFMFSNISVNAKTLENVTEIDPSLKCKINRDIDANIYSMQGVYFFSKYAVYTGYQADDSIGYLTLVDLDECQVIDINGEKVLGHGNDITYNPNNDTYYVTSGLTDNKVYSFKINDNKIVYTDEITANIRLGAFAYDTERDRFFNYTVNKVYALPKLDSSMDLITELNSVDTIYDDMTLVPQGLAYSNDKIYFSRYVSGGDNYILIYDAESGEYQEALYIPKKVFSGEIEGITVVDNMLYLGYNSAGTQSFLEFDLSVLEAPVELTEDNENENETIQETVVKVDDTLKTQNLIVVILGILMSSVGVFCYVMSINKNQNYNE